jgi:putative acetyltransferase
MVHSEIRHELPRDYAVIAEVHKRALGQDEARLVELLRKLKDVIAMVAVSGDQVVGHIMFTPMTVQHAPEGFRAIGLAPLSVVPEFQNQGVGSMLVRAGLAACRRANYDAVFVLGHTKYYPRFGFSRAKDYGLDNEYNAVDAFMVMELKPGVLKTIRGLAKYAPEFREVGC